MMDSSYILPFLGVLVLALLLDYWLTFGLRIWQKKRAGEPPLSAVDQIKLVWQRTLALKSGLSPYFPALNP